MKYEICKEVQIAGASYWTAIAWTDVRACAEEIARAMTAAAPGNRYAALRIAESPEAAASGDSK